MADINKVILVGRLTRDCELKQLSSTTVCNFSLAVNRKRRGQDNTWIDEVSYFDFELYGKMGEALKGYIVRGKQIAVEGQLRQQRWDTSDGQKRSRVVVVVNELQLLGNPSSGQGRSDGYQAPPAQDSYSNDAGNAGNSAGQSSPPAQNFDDDIPF